MPPSPSLGAPLLSGSPSPPLPCGISLLGCGAAATAGGRFIVFGVDFFGCGATATAGGGFAGFGVDVLGCGATATAGVLCAVFGSRVFAVCVFTALREGFTALGVGMRVCCCPPWRAWARPLVVVECCL